MYEYTGIVIEVLDYNTVIIDVDLGFNTRRIMYFKIREHDYFLKEFVTIYENSFAVENFIADTIKNRLVFFTSYKIRKTLDYEVDIVFSGNNNELYFLSHVIKDRFCS